MSHFAFPHPRSKPNVYAWFLRARFLSGAAVRWAVLILSVLLASLPEVCGQTERPRVQVEVKLNVSNTWTLSIEAVGLEHTLSEVADKCFSSEPGDAKHRNDLARFFVNAVVTELNHRMATWEPLQEWSYESLGGTNVTSHLQQKAPGTGGQSMRLDEWLSRYVKPEETALLKNFTHWVPAERNTEEGQDNGRPFKEQIEGIHSGVAGRLILSDGLALLKDLRGAIVLEISRPEPVRKVVLAKLWDEIDGSGPRQLKAEASGVSKGVKLAWNDDSAIQRMALVLRNRGFWLDPGEIKDGQWRTLSWVRIPDGSDTATIGVPHLASLKVSYPSAGKAPSRRMLRAEMEKILPLLLRPEEIVAVGKAFDLRAEYPVQNKIPSDQEVLGRVVGYSRDQRTVRVDLCWLLQHVRTNDANFRAVPASQKELDRAVEVVRITKSIEGNSLAAGCRNADHPSERKLTTPEKALLNDFMLGGIDFLVSVNLPAKSEASEPLPVSSTKPNPAIAPSTGAGKEITTDESAVRETGLARWLHRQGVSAGVGLAKEASQPLETKVVFSTGKEALVGELDGQLTYGQKLSAELDWTPPAELWAGKSSEFLPSEVSLFHETALPRVIDGKDFELESKGVGLGKSWSNHHVPSLRSWAGDAGVRLARLRNVAADGSPSFNQFAITASFSKTVHRNLWDVRDHRGYRVGLTAAGRGESSFDLWSQFDAEYRQGKVLFNGGWRHEFLARLHTAFGRPPADMLPYLGGSDGVRGVRTFEIPARTILLIRNELWMPTPFVRRDYGRAQSWFGGLYDVVKPAAFVDVGWANRIYKTTTSQPWSLGPGVGLRVIMGPVVLNIDYAYGITRPAALGGSGFVFGASARF